MKYSKNNSGDNFSFKEISKGNDQAFTFLFDSYYDPLCKYIYSLTKDLKQAEDIVQDTMFIVWEKRDKIDTKLSVKNYIYKIAYHQFVDNYRKSKEHLNYLDEVQKSALDYFIEKDDEYINKKNAIVLNEIQNLSPKCKEVFLLNKKHGLKYREVAEELNISIKTVEIHISKALKKIRTRFLKEKIV